MPNEASLANLRPWKPGQSGNPSGKPLLNQVLRRLTDNGEDVASFVVAVMKGEVKSVRSLLEKVDTLAGERMRKVTETAVPVGLRLQAAFWIGERIDPQPKRSMRQGDEGGLSDGDDDLITMSEPELADYERHLDSLAAIADGARERRASAASSATIDVTPSTPVDGGHQAGTGPGTSGEDPT